MLILDSSVDSLYKDIRVDDYVYTTNHQRKNKQQNSTVGPFVVLARNDSIYVVDINEESLKVISDHVTPAPRPSTPEETPHTLLDGLDEPEITPSVPDEYVIDRMFGIRLTTSISSASV